MFKDLKYIYFVDKSYLNPFPKQYDDTNLPPFIQYHIFIVLMATE